MTCHSLQKKKKLLPLGNCCRIRDIKHTGTCCYIRYSKTVNLIRYLSIKSMSHHVLFLSCLTELKAMFSRYNYLENHIL